METCTLAHLFIVGFGTQVNQVGRKTGQESLAVRAAGTFVSLGKVFVQFSDGRFEGLSINL